jgi:hypothetical protein
VGWSYVKRTNRTWVPFESASLPHIFFQRFRKSVKKSQWKVGIECDDRLVDLLASGDVAEASLELRQHNESHRARL